MMKKKMIGYTPEEKKEFIEYFLEFRADGKTSINSAYYKAKQCMVSLGKGYPSEMSLRNWLKNGIDEKDSEIPTCPPLDLDGPENEEKKEANPEDFRDQSELEQHPDETPEETESIERTLLRLYRFRRETDIDAVVDMMMPDLKGASEC